MKNNIYLFITFFIIFLFFGCEKKSSNEQNSNQPITIKQKKINYKNGDEYLFRYGFTKGIIYTYKIQSISENTQSQNEKTQTSKVETIYYLEIQPNDSDSPNESILKIKFKSIKVDASLGEQRITYDSENPSDSIKKKNPAFAEYVAFNNADFLVRLGSNGEVLEIFKVDNILKNILGDNSDKVNDNIKNQLRTNIEDQLKSVSQQIFQYFPTDGQKLNSTWTKTSIEKLGEDDAKNIANYHFTNIDNRNGNTIAIIKAELKSETIKRKSIENKGAKYDFDKPLISGSGLVEFDLENGLVLKRDLQTNVLLGMTITQGPQKMKVKSKVSNSVLIELVNYN